jgi:origin recognition complex subunit 2
VGRKGQLQPDDASLTKIISMSPQDRADELRQLKVTNRQEKKELFNRYRAQFRSWYMQLKAGFNLLMYGFGSKRRLINTFAKEWLCDAPGVLVNGFFPGITVRAILVTISEKLKLAPPKHGTANLVEQIHKIGVALKRQGKNDPCERGLYIFVHNIDAAPLRKADSQMLLSLLAEVKHIRLIASVDHLMAPMMWDSQKAARFRWQYLDCTTYEDHLREILSQEKGVLGIEGGSIAITITIIIEITISITITINITITVTITITIIITIIIIITITITIAITITITITITTTGSRGNEHSTGGIDNVLRRY